MDYTIATVATNWWITQIKNRCKELYPEKVIGDDSDLVIVDDCLKEDLSRFEKLLSEEILYHAQKGLYLSLTCCYYPNGLLKTLAQRASISKTYFPARAEMRILEKCVEVSLDGDYLRKLPLATEQL